MFTYSCLGVFKCKMNCSNETYNSNIFIFYTHFLIFFLYSEEFSRTMFVKKPIDYIQGNKINLTFLEQKTVFKNAFAPPNRYQSTTPLFLEFNKQESLFSHFPHALYNFWRILPRRVNYSLPTTRYPIDFGVRSTAYPI